MWLLYKKNRLIFMIKHIYKKNNLLFIFMLIQINFVAQPPCMVDMLINKLNVDSSKYVFSNYNYIYPDTIGISTKYGYLKVASKLNRIDVMMNGINFEGDNINDLVGDIRKSIVSIYNNDWVIIISDSYSLGWILYCFFVIDIKNYTFKIFTTIDKNCYLLNDYNNDKKIDFFQLKPILLGTKTDWFSRANIQHYKYENNTFILQNDTIPNDVNIYYSHNCGCYERKTK